MQSQHKSFFRAWRNLVHPAAEFVTLVFAPMLFSTQGRHAATDGVFVDLLSMHFHIFVAAEVKLKFHVLDVHGGEEVLYGVVPCDTTRWMRVGLVTFIQTSVAVDCEVVQLCVRQPLYDLPDTIS